MVLPKLKDFLDAFDAPWPVAAGVAVGSGVLLYLHGLGIKYLRALPDWADTTLFVLVVYGSVVVGMKILVGLGHMIGRYRAKRQRIRNIDSALDSLNAEERGVFSYLIGNNQRSFTTNITDAHVATLIQKRLIVRGSGDHSILNWPHTVPSDVWNALQLRRTEFE